MTKIKTCPHCTKILHPTTGLCPTCPAPTAEPHTTQIPTTPTQPSNSMGTVIIIAIIVIIIGAFLSGGDGSPTTPNKKDPSQYAITMSWEFVKLALKSPATADFGRITNHTQHPVAGHTNRYIVTGPVDSQNGFGAMIRSHYRCVLEYRAKRWYPIELQID